jgi:hypothetical protein
MAKILTVIVLFALTANVVLNGQVALTNGPHSIEISGAISTYYNYRFLKPGEENRRKDRFRLRDAQLQIEGRIRNHIEYEFQIDFADIALGQLDPENPGLMDGYVQYNHKFASVRVGYGKVPYSRSSLVPFIYTPYWQRAELVRGNVFSRRDIGVMVAKNFFRQLVNIQAGVYTGLGEIGLRGDNDPSGKPEYIGRAEFAWPSKYRYRDIDTRVTPIPMFTIGANARYTNKQLPAGTFFPSGAAGEFGIKVLDGERFGYGADVAAQYKGFSAQFEIHQLKNTPVNPANINLVGLPDSITGGYFLTGGYIVQVNYFSKKFNTILSARFDELDLNDLVSGNSQRWSFAAAYQLDGFKSMIKVQWWSIVEEEVLDPLRWNEQVRIGWQFVF